jgi:hypothetical protein
MSYEALSVYGVKPASLEIGAMTPLLEHWLQFRAVHREFYKVLTRFEQAHFIDQASDDDGAGSP